MKKNYKLGFILGIIIYVILHGLFNVSRIFAFAISLGSGYIILNYLRIYELKIRLKSLNQFVDITDQSAEKIITENKELKECIHDIKNDLYTMKNLLGKSEFNKMEEKIDNLILECAKIHSPAICINIYVDSFLTKFISDHPQISLDIKINVPEKINMKAMDLSSFMLCLLHDSLINESGKMKFHMCVNNNELSAYVVYPNEITTIQDDSQTLLEIIVKKYHGEIEIKRDEIRCILFLD